ncbi:MAG: carboxylesterase family protein [Bacteroidales bacterium]|jgi:para-nitrobenzyl esterase|nr:carboxylesterase family protein [Bacteroidales bacterium]
MKKQSCIFIISIFTALMFASCVKSGPNPVLTVEGGQIQGVETEIAGIMVYKGIPFAAPPVGDLRWREPQPVISWDGIKICDTFGAAAPQKLTDSGSFYDKEFYAQSPHVKNEDCLYLNVWTPATGKTDAKLPVAMWIHGGAYRNGFGHEHEFDGVYWAQKGVILVTINYRLGVLGFLAHPELTAENPNGVSGNYGILDQIAALKWIKANISQFGGDPNQITVFGQSAGAGSVQTLVASPLTTGLIQGAIIQSGGGIGSRPAVTLADAEQTGAAIARFYGCVSIEEMRNVAAEEFGDFENRTADFVKAENRIANTSPVVDGYLLNESFSDAAINGNLPNIPYIIGGTVGDMRGNSKPVADFGLVMEEQGKKAYAYQFARPLPGDDAGAFHSSELWFIFNTLNRSWRPFTEGDKALSAYMVDCWTNFAKYGNPNGTIGETWQPYTKENTQFMLFNTDESANTSAMGQPLAPTAR